MARPPSDAPLLSPEKIVVHTLAMLDEGGVEALSMRKLAAELGVSPKSLYHYFPNKEELLQGVYAHILTEMDLPDLTQGTWQERFLRLAHSLRQTMLRHASFIGYYFQGHRVSTDELDVYESLYGLLKQIGLPEDVIMRYGSVLVIFLVGFCYAELNGNFAPTVFLQRKAFAQQQPERFPLTYALPLPEEGRATEPFFETALALMISGVQTQAEIKRLS